MFSLKPGFDVTCPHCNVSWGIEWEDDVELGTLETVCKNCFMWFIFVCRCKFEASKVKPAPGCCIYCGIPWECHGSRCGQELRKERLNEKVSDAV